MRRDSVNRIVRLEATRYLRDRVTWAGMIALVVLLIVGAADYWNSLPPRSAGGRLFGEAYLVALSLAFHASIAHDRATRFDSFLVSNFVDPSDLYFGKILAAVSFLAGTAAVAFMAALITALGDIQYGAHYTALFLFASLLLLPVVVLTEILTTTRYPVPLILAFAFAVLAVYNRTGDLPRALHWMGLDGQLDMTAATLRSLAALLLTASMYPLYRRRLGVRR